MRSVGLVRLVAHIAGLVGKLGWLLVLLDLLGYLGWLLVMLDLQGWLVGSVGC